MQIQTILNVPREGQTVTIQTIKNQFIGTVVSSCFDEGTPSDITLIGICWPEKKSRHHTITCAYIINWYNMTLEEIDEINKFLE